MLREVDTTLHRVPALPARTARIEGNTIETQFAAVDPDKDRQELLGYADLRYDDLVHAPRPGIFTFCIHLPVGGHAT
jgi:hypothetical protein